MAPRDGGQNGPGRRPWVNQPAVADGQGPPDWSDDEDEDNDIVNDDIVNDDEDDDIVVDDIVNDGDAEEGKVHHMVSRILDLRICFTKFGKSFLKLNYRSYAALNFLPWEFLLVKKVEIEKTKTTFIISVLKFVY